MSIGISTLCFSEKPLKDALDWSEQRVRTVEILDGGMHTLFPSNVELLKSYSLKYSIHAPVGDVNIASIFEPTRKASIEVLRSRFEIAADIEAPVIIHPGHVSWESDRQYAQRQLSRSILDLITLGQDMGVKFYIENLMNWHSSLVKTPDDLALLGKASLILDIGHANTCGCLRDFLSRSYRHYHIHDNLGIDDTHFALGQGNIPLEILEPLLQDQQATKIIEVNTTIEAEQTLSVINKVGAT